MAESVCTGDCLDVDASGRIIVVPDGRTIVCESDGAGGTHLVAKTIDCDAWPYSCGVDVGAEQVFCSGDNLYVRKPYFKMGSFFASNEDPAIASKLRSPTDTVVAEQGFDIVNADTCGRTARAKIWLNWNKYAINVLPGGTYEFNYEFSVNGGTSWSRINDSFATNDSTVTRLMSPGGTTNYTVIVDIAGGGTRNIRMRMLTGSFNEPTNISTSQSSQAIYGFDADWIISSEY